MDKMEIKTKITSIERTRKLSVLLHKAAASVHYKNSLVSMYMHDLLILDGENGEIILCALIYLISPL